MFKKVLSYIFILSGLAVLVLSTSRTAMQYIAEARDNEKWWGAYPCKHGDLVSLSYLDFVKKFTPLQEPFSIKPPSYSGPKNNAIYLNGDSYAWHLKDSAFAGACYFEHLGRLRTNYYHLDTPKRNILLIEIAEREVREYFSSLRMLNELYDSVKMKKEVSATLPGAILYAGTKYASFVPDFHFKDIFNKNINQNLQCNLFNYNFIIPMFEYKAALNYYLFNRASGDVEISDDRSFLFLKETVSFTDVSSSYLPISAEEVNRLVNNFNTIYDRYKAEGFRDVYLAIIPNPATIMQPARYNNLIPLIQTDKRLRMKIIDAYTAFKNSPKLLYQPGDTHWNNAGRQLWLDLVNKKLLN